jgi:hypothetical protein
MVNGIPACPLFMIISNDNSIKCKQTIRNLDRFFTFDTVVVGDYHEEGEGWDSIYHFKPEHIFVPCSKRGSGFP